MSKECKLALNGCLDWCLSLQFYSRVFFCFSVALMFKMWLSQIHPNAVVIYTIMILLVVIGLSVQKINKILKIFLILNIPVLLFLIVLSYSKTGYLVLLLSLIAFAILTKKSLGLSFKNILKVNILKVLFLSILIFFTIIVFPEIKTRIKSRFEKSEFLTERLLYWELSSKVLSDNPLVGTGLRSYYLLSRYLGRERYSDAMLLRRLFLGETMGAHVHNSYLEIAATCGLFGLFCFLWILFVFFKFIIYFSRVVKDDSQNRFFVLGAVAGIFAFFVGAIFDHLLEFWGIGVLLFTYLGIISSFYFNKKEISIERCNFRCKNKMDKIIIYSFIILYLLVVTSRTSATILFETGKSQFLVKNTQKSRYFDYLNIIDPLNWKYNDFLFERASSKFSIP